MSFKGKMSHFLGLATEKGIITEQQKREIVDLAVSESGNMGFFKILGIIGSLCIGLGLILIVSSNWSVYPDTLRLLLALFLPLLFLGLGYYFSYVKKELAALGTSFIFAGGICIGATIGLIGQIYNTDGTVGSLFLLWTLLVIPLVFVFRLKILSFLAIVLFYTSSYYIINDQMFIFYRDHDKIILSFSLFSSFLAIGSYIANQMSQKRFEYLLKPVILVSFKIIFASLFLSTIDNFYFDFLFIGSVIFQNILFLAVVFGTMWWAHNNNEIILRHMTFFWLGLYFVVKFFVLFSGYFSAGLFFISGGIFLIGLLYGFMKLNTFLGKKKLKDENTL